MGRGHFTQPEIDSLRSNPYVSDVNQTSIAYSSEFKFLFMEEYTKGKRPVQIFRDAGFDTEILGSKRIERACARWKESYQSGTLGTRCAILNKTYPEISESPENQRKRTQNNKKKLINQCRAQEKTIRHLRAELQMMQRACQRGLCGSVRDFPCAEICQIIAEVTAQEEYQSCISHLCEIAGINRSLYYRYKKKEEPR